MWEIEWFRDGSSVQKETSDLTDEAEVIAQAKLRALEVAQHHVGHEPDSFRVTDATGKLVGEFRIGM